MNKLVAFLLIVILGCLFPHLLLALLILGALAWVALDIFMVWAVHKELSDNPERKRRLEERERQVPAADRFQAWLDSNQRR